MPTAHPHHDKAHANTASSSFRFSIAVSYFQGDEAGTLVVSIDGTELLRAAVPALGELVSQPGPLLSGIFALGARVCFHIICIIFLSSCV